MLLRLFGSWSGCLYLLFEDDGSDTACSQTYHTTTNEGEEEGRKRFGKVQQEENGGKAILLDPLAIVPVMSAAM